MPINTLGLGLHRAGRARPDGPLVGTLVVLVPQALEDDGNLTLLLDATREIARRVLSEVLEAVERVAPNAKVAGL